MACRLFEVITIIMRSMSDWLEQMLQGQPLSTCCQPVIGTFQCLNAETQYKLRVQSEGLTQQGIDGATVIYFPLLGWVITGFITGQLRHKPDT